MNLKHYLYNFRVQSALKITLGGLVCILISNIFHLESSYLSVLFLYLITLLYHGQTFSAGVESIIGVFVSGAVSLLVVYVFLDSRLLYIVLMSVWIFFVMLFVDKYFLPAVLSAIVASMSMFVAIFSSVTQTTVTVENYLIQLILGSLIAWIVDEYIWPHKSRKALDLTFSSLYSYYAKCFERLAGGGNAHDDEGGDSVKIDVFNNLISLIGRAGREDRGGGFREEPFMKMTSYAKSIYIRLSVLEDFMSRKHRCLENEEVSGELGGIMRGLSSGFAELASAFSGGHPAPPPSDDVGDRIKSLEAVYVKLHSDETGDREYFEDLLALGAIPPLLGDINGLYGESCAKLRIVQEGTYDSIAGRRVTHAPEVETVKKASGAYLNREGVRRSVKTVVIIMLLLVGEMFLNLPGSSQASFYGVLFGSMPNTGQAHLKGRLAIIGVLAGLLYGLVGLVILSQITHFAILLLLFSLGILVSAYVATGSPKTAYSGMQAGLMIPYVFLISTAPELNLDKAVTRVCALLVACSVGLLVLHNLWPVSPYEKLKKNISSALRTSGLIFGRLLMRDEAESGRIDSLVTPLAASLPTSSALLFDARYVISDEKLHSGEFIEIIESLEVIFAELETIKKTIYADPGNELVGGYLAHMAPDYKRICGFFEAAAGEFSGGAGPGPDVARLMEDIKRHRQEFRETGFWKGFSLGDVEHDVLIAAGVDGILGSLSGISACIVSIKESEEESAAAPAEPEAR